MSLISVIVPVYKVEPYLQACLDSLLASTHKQLEIILVDDGSPDRCPEICDAYAQRDNRIRVIHQENEGLVGARNTGLRHASGDYIGFIDSDDCISPVMFERLVAVMEQTGADVVCCEYNTDWNVVLQKCDAPAVASACFDRYDEQLAVLTCAPSIRSVTWTSGYVINKLYRRNMIRVPFRAECLGCEDIMFNWEFITGSRVMAILPEKLYFYRQNSQSIMGTYNSSKPSASSARKGAAMINMWDHLERNTTVSDPAIQGYFHSRAAYMAHGGLWRIYGVGLEEAFSEEVSRARRLIRDHAIQIFRDKETYNRKVSAVMHLCRYCFPLWVLAARISGRRS